MLHPCLVLSEDLSVVSQSVSWVRCEKCGLLFPCADLHCSQSQSVTHTQAKCGVAPGFAVYYSAIRSLGSVLLLRESMI